MRAHPWLEPIERFQRMVDDAAAREPRCGVEVPSREAWAEDEAAGIPLLRSRTAGVRLSAAVADALGRLLGELAEAPLPGRMADACREIEEELRGPEERRRAIAWAIAGEPLEPPAHPGLLRFLCWIAARRVLEPVLQEAAAPGEERWGRGECPTCGALPLSAQLVQAQSGRARLLACGCCGTRWRYRRIGCPFCGNEAQERLGILEVEGEAGLRIDVCGACGGYLKTYTGEGDDELFLADWPTLHLDVLAMGRGFRRMGASLYDLPSDERRSEP
jgi:FdhE protein